MELIVILLMIGVRMAVDPQARDLFERPLLAILNRYMGQDKWVSSEWASGEVEQPKPPGSLVKLRDVLVQMTPIFFVCSTIAVIIVAANIIMKSLR